MSARILTLIFCVIALGLFAQTPGGQMKLTVLDSQSAQPLAGVKVRAWTGSGLVTDDSGNCTFPLPVGGAGRFFYRIALTKPGYVGKYITWSKAQKDKIEDIPAAYTVRLDKGVAVGGVVKNEKGEPIAGARVIFSGPSPQTDGQRERSDVAPGYHSERTDADGHWQNSEIPLDFRGFSFRLIHPDYVPATFACEVEDVTDPTVVQWNESNFLSGTSVMLLTHGIELSGVVTDSSGKPVANATITRNHEWRNPLAALTTGADGRFKIINLRPGEIILTIQSVGLAGQTQQLTLSNGMPEVKIEMKSGNLLQGQVVDEAGKPLSGAIVQMDKLDLGPLEYEWQTVTDEQGHFAWDSAPEGAHPYYFSANGRRPRAEPGLIADGSEKIVALRKAENGDKTVMDGRVTDSITKLPIGEFTVCLKEFNGETVQYSRKKVSDTNGVYSVSVDPTLVGCMIEITAPGYAPFMSDRKACRDGDQRLDFFMVKGEGIFGTVYLPDGKPAAGAEIAVCTDEGGATVGNAHLKDRFQRTIVATDDSGKFLMPKLEGAQSLCAVCPAGFAETNIEDAKGPFHITLVPWGIIQGIAISSGKLVQGEKIGLARASGRPGVSVDREEFSTVTGVDGAFEFSNVPPGNVALLRLVSNNIVADKLVDVFSGQTTGGPLSEFDFGEDAVPQKGLKIGDVAPQFEIKTIDGKPLRLADYRGKYVLLDFWATWCGPCVAETPHLKATFDAFGTNEHFAMIGLSLDDAASAPLDYTRKNNIKWTQGFLGQWSASTVTPRYGVNAIPSIFLVDPDGKIIERDLRGDGIREAVEKALGTH